VFKAILVYKVHKDTKVQQDRRVFRELRAIKVFKEIKDTKVLPEHRVFKVHKVIRDIKDIRVTRVTSVLKDLVVLTPSTVRSTTPQHRATVVLLQPTSLHATHLKLSLV
jgi:hypothetical protein